MAPKYSLRSARFFRATSYRIGDFTFTNGRVGSGTLSATTYGIGGAPSTRTYSGYSWDEN